MGASFSHTSSPGTISQRGMVTRGHDSEIDSLYGARVACAGVKACTESSLRRPVRCLSFSRFVLFSIYREHLFSPLP
ncbi:hypothetical protein HBI56_024460 [Parastagonospora nodorum]|uniref:Uncharacterized protein n=1 Tax=Phaeosphaeria nodorum (strain SN15 / ATCC MYA-4574 / FGSC 10173) TaxID=321614 RepID=A0A7U2F936_PHANO|nr:hypothetical protein HBH56_024070 [Parastagonospora nodorum]QRC98765.1 hypothetical protein JI435_061360 [Parastagonospora nodorum SN15]KAH3934431.1 hypothetical protein HBH54_057950 [Parastagonospora nodorum]KAH3976051.1 hypothetical protein HBH51_079730 [Parastagonospora nodorum]KAH4141868.1 hypothetical protein HBH45_058810 [Parastagonospora nodorum]